MATEPSIMNRIKELIGEFKSSIPTYHPLINDAFNFVAKAIPVESPLWDSEDSLNSTFHTSTQGGRQWEFKVRNQGDTLTTNRKILGVFCYYPLNDSDGTHQQWDPDADEQVHDAETDDAYYVRAKKITYEEFNKGLNAESIFFHKYNYEHPVWCITPNSKVLVSPVLNRTYNQNDDIYTYYGAIKIRYFTYFNGSDLSSTQQIQQDFGFPADAAHAGCLKSAMNILQARIADASQDEEDSELLSILTSQHASLEAQFNTSMTMLLGDTSSLGGKA